jgi:23S rRNA (guanosine2251-2'-O)-methyltransferase
MNVIYGINPIKVLLRQEETVLEKIYIASGRGGSPVKEISEIARQKRIPVEYHAREYLDELTGVAHHQGVAALRRDFVYAHLDDLIKNRNGLSGFNLIIILDSIMDPQNLGSIIRTSYCLGANGVVIPTDRAAPVSAAVIKASAGSAQQLPIARVTNLSQTLDYLKDRDFWIFGADAHEGGNLQEMDFNCHLALVLGGEAKGIRPLLIKKCDFLVSIPLGRNFDSLNVAVAAGIIQYEILNQRRRPNSRKKGN